MATISCSFGLVVFSAVVLAVFCSFPDVEKYEGVFLGEGINCAGTSSKVITSPQTVVVQEEAIVRAVGEAIAEGVSEVEAQPEEWAVTSAAEKSSKKILEAVAEAAAQVQAEINSPNAGCWAIGYGRAEAVAIADVTVTAISEAFAKAGEESQVRVNSESVENDVQSEIKEVVMRLQDGRGGGFQSITKKVTASVKATAVNCALARAFAQIVEEKTQAIVQASAGCQVLEPFRIPPDFIGCECVRQNDFGAPNLCGQYGDKENGDYICYTSSNCFCSQQSLRYPQLKWRYCGATFDTMKQWLNAEDKKISGSRVI
eukprot:TRINITY_DN19549_c0_g1_i1.p1 TRINITY_DN19549_c0_g1~~TRINITY_DN19549_c0_g1_i1.p1  ORF type:complete len:315 (-),score=59.96 TRINITY_DN19549_c0_g1_i1:271-1215(-)